VNGKPVNITNLTEAERFAAVVETMPPSVQRFVRTEEQLVSLRQLESIQDRLEREARADFGGWAGG
jgi:hypothetical protein